MNHKGQTLVLFTLLLPIFFLIFLVMMDTGITLVQKRKIDSIMKDACQYATNHTNDQDGKLKTEQLLYQNSDDILELHIQIEPDYVSIGASVRIVSLSNLWKEKTLYIQYHGNKIDDEWIIKKE